MGRGRGGVFKLGRDDGLKGDTGNLQRGKTIGLKERRREEFDMIEGSKEESEEGCRRGEADYVSRNQHGLQFLA
jgi:hypothetical protein